MKISFVRSIGFKILLAYIILALITLSFVISIIFENQVELISKNTTLETERQISNLIGSIKKFSFEMKKGSLFSYDKNKKSFNEFINLISPHASSYFIITENNKVLHTSNNAQATPPNMAEDVLRSITARNFSGKEYYLRVDDKKRSIYCYIPLGDFQLGNTILLMVKDVSSLDDSLKNLYYQSIYVVIVALFFHAIFAFILFRYIIHPVRLLTQGAQRLASGDLGVRIVLDERQDEFASLAESFNSMADSISNNVSTLSNKVKEAKEIEKKADTLTIKDELTGLFNRFYMLERINEEVKKTGIKKNSSAFIIIEVDNLENITKVYGKKSRDIILLEISKIISRNCRRADVISRFSDDNIAMLTTDSSVEYVKNLSEKIRHAIETNTIITPDGKFSVTASIGASFIKSGSKEKPVTGNDCISAAETALAQARKKGKNRIEIIT